MLFDALKAVLGGIACAAWMTVCYFLLASWFAWYLQVLLGCAIVMCIVYITPNRMTGHYVRPFAERKK